MTTVKHTYTINNFQQLIDLNGDSTNFDAKFRVSSQNNAPFEIVVVDQTTLDNTPSLNYTPVTRGVIEGTVHQDKNVYQNFFIALRAANPCQCEVEISKSDLPIVNKIPAGMDENDEKMISSKSSINNLLSSDINWRKWITIAVIIGGLAFLYWYYSGNQEQSDDAEINVNVKSSFHSPLPQQVAVPNNPTQPGMSFADIASKAVPQAVNVAPKMSASPAGSSYASPNFASSRLSSVNSSPSVKSSVSSAKSSVQMGLGARLKAMCPNV